MVITSAHIYGKKKINANWKNEIIRKLHSLQQQQRRPRFGFAFALTISIRYKSEVKWVEKRLKAGQSAWKAEAADINTLIC